MLASKKILNRNSLILFVYLNQHFTLLPKMRRDKTSMCGQKLTLEVVPRTKTNLSLQLSHLAVTLRNGFRNQLQPADIFLNPFESDSCTFCSRPRCDEKPQNFHTHIHFPCKTKKKKPQRHVIIIYRQMYLNLSEMKRCIIHHILLNCSKDLEASELIACGRG